MDTATEDQAMAVLNGHINAAIGQLASCPRLEAGLVGSMPCDDPTDAGPLGRVFVEAHYWLRGHDPARNREVFDRLHDYWTSHGYRVLSDLRDHPTAPQLKVRHEDDGFSISLRENLDRDLKISGSSPCIWPNDDGRAGGI